MFAKLVSEFYSQDTIKRFKTYLLLACDTTCQLLPDSEATRKIGTHTNQYKTVASQKIALFFDILNQFYYHASLHPKQAADLPCVQDYIKELPKTTLTIYDRGFGSLLLIFLHSHYGSKCLIRLKVSFSNYVKDFVKSDDNERVIEVNLGTNCVKSLASMGIKRFRTSSIQIRLIRVKLPSGEDEILLTNVCQKELSIEEAYQLYGMRWGIETTINYLKNVFKLGIFSGYSKTAISQDIWCNLIAQNLQNCLIWCQEVDLSKINSRRKKVYKVNRAVACGTLLGNIQTLFCCPIATLQSKIDLVLGAFIRSLERVKTANKERLRKRQRPNDRHTTEKNYKHNF